MTFRFFSSKYTISCLLLLGLTTLLGACGGGGGGGGPSYPDLSYSGVQTQAVIDQTNADEFPFVVLEGSGDTQNIPLTVQIESQSNGKTPDMSAVNKATNAITDIIKNNFGASTQQVIGASITGSCGGTYTYDENINQSASTFSGSTTFSNFCEGGLSNYGFELTMHGRMNFSGSYILDINQNPILTSLTIDVVYLSFAFNDGVDTFTEEFAGTITVNSFDSFDEPEDITVTVRYEFNGKIYQVENFQADTTGNISGTFYHPDNGYVVISTTSLFTHVTNDPDDTTDDQFCDGTLQVTGVDNNTPANTVTVVFTDYSCTTYDICVTDTSGTLCSTGNNWGDEPTNWM